MQSVSLALEKAGLQAYQNTHFERKPYKVQLQEHEGGTAMHVPIKFTYPKLGRTVTTSFPAFSLRLATCVESMLSGS